MSMLAASGRMPTVYDADIAGDGSDDLSGGGGVLYAVVHFTSTPFGARECEVGSPDHVLRAGWISFGDHLSVVGGVDRSYWREVLHLNFLDWLWTPVPSTNSSTPLSIVASRVRWSIAPGGAAHLYVFGP